MLQSSYVKNGLNGIVEIPGDKSISHRSIIIPSISNGISEISNLLISDDVKHTMNAFKSMGIKIEIEKNNILINGKGLNGLKQPNKNIYLGNSGTSARLLTGLLSSQNFVSTLEGDLSLSKRPMNRIIDPLTKMGAKFSHDNQMLPIKIDGRTLKPLKFDLIIPSAQVKSGIIFAALNTNGITEIKENKITRDHTEIMLKSFGADITVQNTSDGKIIKITGGKELNSNNIFVPSDLSSSAFFIVAALINKNSNIKLKNININPTRDGILRALKLMGANIEIFNKRLLNEEIIADMNIYSSKLKGCNLNADMAELMIDEYPILAIAAANAETPSTFKGLKELKVKESDRLELIRLNLERCGVKCIVEDDNLHIIPKKTYNVQNNEIRTDFDHRIAMSFAVMGSTLDTNLKILESDSIDTSFPSFIECFNKIGGKLIE